MAARSKKGPTLVTDLRQLRMPSYLFERSTTWHAVAPARTQTSPIVLAMAKFSSPVRTRLRLELPMSSRLLVPCCSKKLPHFLCSIHKTLRRLLPSKLRLTSSRFRSLPLIPIFHRSSGSQTLKTLSTDQTFSTLTSPLQLPVSQIWTISDSCAPWAVRAIVLVILAQRWWRRRTVPRTAS